MLKIGVGALYHIANILKMRIYYYINRNNILLLFYLTNIANIKNLCPILIGMRLKIQVYQLVRIG